MAFYDGATRGRRFSDWSTPKTSPNSEVRFSLDLLVRRSHDLVRNNPWAARAASVIPRDVVGYGITYGVKHRSARTQQRLQDLMARHYETTAIDADGRHDIYGLQRLAQRTVVESGEVLVRKRPRRAGDGLPLPFQVQILEPELLDSNKTQLLEGGGYVINGVEFDAIGTEVAYWLYPEHPGDGILNRGRQSRRVPATNVRRIYRVDRPGQVRGIPWVAPVIVTLKDFQDYDDFQLVRQKIAACFSVIETSATPDEEFDPAENPRQEPVQPGMWVRAAPGYDVKFPSPPAVDGYVDYATVTARKISTGMDIPEFLLTGNLEGINFSAGRLGWLDYQRFVEETRWLMLIPGFCGPVLQWGIDLADDLGLVPGAKAATVSHTPPAREMIDPTKEVPSAKDEVRAGLATLSEKLRERGLDPEKHFAEYAADMAKIDELKLVLDSDPRVEQRQAQAQADAQAAAAADTAAEDENEQGARDDG
jgi:lambda family phage portal protein